MKLSEYVDACLKDPRAPCGKRKAESDKDDYIGDFHTHPSLNGWEKMH